MLDAAAGGAPISSCSDLGEETEGVERFVPRGAGGEPAGGVVFSAVAGAAAASGDFAAPDLSASGEMNAAFAAVTRLGFSLLQSLMGGLYPATIVGSFAV